VELLSTCLEHNLLLRIAVPHLGLNLVLVIERLLQEML
jgi:hypothetical protein